MNIRTMIMQAQSARDRASKMIKEALELNKRLSRRLKRPVIHDVDQEKYAVVDEENRQRNMVQVKIK